MINICTYCGIKFKGRVDSTHCKSAECVNKSIKIANAKYQKQKCDRDHHKKKYVSNSEKARVADNKKRNDDFDRAYKEYQALNGFISYGKYRAIYDGYVKG